MTMCHILSVAEGFNKIIHTDIHVDRRGLTFTLSKTQRRHQYTDIRMHTQRYPKASTETHTNTGTHKTNVEREREREREIERERERECVCVCKRD